MEKKETFNYIYSAQQQEEIKSIRKKYMAQEEDKMEQLRKLDRSVNQKATMNSLIVGITGTLIMGCGMSLAMTDLYAAFELTAMLGIIIGSVIGLVGMVFICLAYLVYQQTIKKERERVAAEILRLSDELLHD